MLLHVSQYAGQRAPEALPLSPTARVQGSQARKQFLPQQARQLRGLTMSEAVAGQALLPQLGHRVPGSFKTLLRVLPTQKSCGQQRSGKADSMKQLRALRCRRNVHCDSPIGPVFPGSRNRSLLGDSVGPLTHWEALWKPTTFIFTGPYNARMNSDQKCHLS